jgi:glycosyltransferase involved in cell wall biosynthesis
VTARLSVLYEGLGLPVLEAMACGAPVVAGDNSSLRELVGRQDALFDAASVTSTATAMANCSATVLSPETWLRTALIG